MATLSRVRWSTSASRRRVAVAVAVRSSIRRSSIRLASLTDVEPPRAAQNDAPTRPEGTRGDDGRDTTNTTRLAKSLGARRRRRHGGGFSGWIRGVQSWEREGVAGDDARAGAHARGDGGADGGNEWGRSVVVHGGRRRSARGEAVSGDGANGLGRTGGGAIERASASARRGVTRGFAASATTGGEGDDATTSVSHDSTDETGDSRAEEDANDRAILRERVLRAALRRVNEHGWTDAAIDAALRDLKLSPAMRSCVRADESMKGKSSDLAGELVGYYEEELDAAFQASVVDESDALKGMNSKERMKWLIRKRVEMIAPKLETWPGALMTLASPNYAAATFRRRAALADFIAEAADVPRVDVLPESLDAIRSHADRAVIMAIYSAVELHMLTDSSKSYRSTWAFLSARVDEVSSARVDVMELKSYVDVLARGAGIERVPDVFATSAAKVAAPLADVFSKFFTTRRSGGC